MKINRQAVFDKFQGHCAYCGCDITMKNFQVDHIWPKHISHLQKGLDPDRFENLNPACRRCNIHKWGMPLDGIVQDSCYSWRKKLQLQVARLKKTALFNRALRFGQIEITEKPIVFYFEREEK